jgi:predicted house-cleaning noncanonical NTP pyrophosphatase (MazG superfamily)
MTRRKGVSVYGYSVFKKKTRNLFKIYSRMANIPKLVRDKIPQMIQSRGERCVFHKANNKEYIYSLLEKLIEEAEEVRSAENKDSIAAELADVLEVYDALLTVYGLSHDEIVAIKEQKKVERGGFEGGIILDEW